MSYRQRLVCSVLVVALVAGTAFGAAPENPQEGRGSFLLQQIPLGIWYGVGTSVCLSGGLGTKGQVAVGLLSASAFYFGPLALVWNRPMSHAQAHLAVGCGYRGIAAGFAFGDLFDVGVRHHGSPYYYESYDVRPRMGLMVLTSLGSQVGGYFLAREMSLGQATLVTAYSDFGWSNGLLAELAGASLGGPTKLAPYFLGGLAVGTTAGWLRQRSWECTEGQVTFVRTASFLGTLLPLGAIYALTGVPFEYSDADHFLWLAPLMIAGNVGAVYGAERLVREAPLSTGEGYITLGCTVGGALFGAGLGWLVTNENSDRLMRPVIGLGTLGALGGLTLGFRLTSGWEPAFSAASRGDDAWSRLHINTGELAGAAAGLVSGNGFSAPRLVVFEF